MDQETKAILEAYWQKTLKPPLTPPDYLPLTQAAPLSQEGQRTVETGIPQQTFDRLRKMSKNSDTALFILALSALNIVLSRTLDSAGLVVITPLPPAIAESPNLVCCRNAIEPGQTVKETVIQNRQVVQEAFDYGGYPFERLKQRFNDWSLTAFWLEGFQEAGRQLHETCDLVFSLHPGSGQLRLSWRQQSSPRQPFSKSLLESFCRNLVYFLGNIHSSLDQPVALAGILDPGEKQRLLTRFNDTAMEYPREKTLHQWLADRAAQAPDAVAIRDVQPGVHMTFRCLNRDSDRIARLLMAKAVAPGDTAAIMTRRSAAMMAAIFGILKTGAAYLPIDPAYPKERIGYILKDSNAAMLIDDQFLDAIDFQQEPLTEDVPLPSLASGHPAYVIYTSGSTGKPKGVVITHRNVTNFIAGIDAIIPFREYHVILCLTTISFDIFGLETLLPILRGSRVIMGEHREQFNGNAAASQLIREAVTHLQVTPSRLELLMAFPAARQALSKLETLMVGGEAFPMPLLGRVRAVTSCRIFNMYGPTETTIWSSVKDLTGKLALNIGAPIANTQIRILDGNNLDMPVGGAGELCIGGDGVGMGYLNKPELTAQRFFIHESAGVLYRTGDLARWLPDGNIDYLGRTDFQVKIRGFRIEPGEIERVLISHDNVHNAVAAAKQDSGGHIYLCAYVVSNGEKRPGSDEIKTYLSGQLPEYMMPAHVMFLDALPLTPNGKVDRKALPDPDLAGSAAYATPRDELERRLAGIWASAMNIDSAGIGIDHNFYDLGGHSLTAAAISAGIFSRLKLDISPGQMMKTPTIRSLSEYIRVSRHSPASGPPLQPQEDREYYPVSAAQIRLFIQQQKNPSGTQYNMTLAYQVTGNPDPQRIEQIFNRLLERHEPLRTSFFMLHDQVVQKVSPAQETGFAISRGKVEKGDNDIVREELKRFIRPFVLSDAPSMRVRWLEVEDLPGHAYIFFDIHHIISDALSMQMLVGEFAALYDNQPLEPLPVQYRDYVVWYRRHFQEKAIRDGERYWLKRLEGFTFTRVPPDISGGFAQVKGATASIALDSDVFKNMDRFCKSHQITRFTLLSSILALVLAQETGNLDISIGTPVSNRSHPFLKGLLGLFLRVVLVRFNLSEEKSFLEQLRQNTQEINSALENSAYELETLAARLKETQGIKTDELFSILFNYLPPRTPLEDREGGLTFRPFGAGKSAPRFDITFYVLDRPDSIAITAEFKANLYYPDSIAHMLKQMHSILELILNDENVAIGRLIGHKSGRAIPEEDDFSAGFNDEL